MEKEDHSDGSGHDMSTASSDEGGAHGADGAVAAGAGHQHAAAAEGDVTADLTADLTADITSDLTADLTGAVDDIPEMPELKDIMRGLQAHFDRNDDVQTVRQMLEVSKSTRVCIEQVERGPKEAIRGE